MSRYIDADALKTRLDYCVTKGMGSTIAFTFKHMIDEQPTVDVVKVVRCKDCKYCVEHYDAYGNVLYCFCKNWYIGTDADGFCYEGERKDDGKIH